MDGTWTAVVTGGAGFIGSNLVDGLLAAGHRVRVLDDLSTGRRANLSDAQDHDRFSFREGSVTDREAVQEVCEGADVVFHQAALPSVGRSLEEPVRTRRVNVGGTMNVLEAARAADVTKVVYASSSSVYGGSGDLSQREDMAVEPRSPYAASKLAGEQYCRAYAESYGLPTVCLRYFNVYGPRQYPDAAYAGVIPSFMGRLADGDPPVVHGDGEQTRDFTFVADAVQANMRAAQEDADGIFNIGTGNRTSINELADVLIDRFDADVTPHHGEPREGDVDHSLADIGRARERLGYEPAYTIEEGLEETLSWYLS